LIQNYGDPFRSIVICVDAYQDRRLEGAVHSPIREEKVLFRSTIQMVLEIESRLNDKVQPFTAKRSFLPASGDRKNTAVRAAAEKGKLATFTLKILFRQNASWQGSVFWHEGKTEESFRSVLELLLLMNSALQSRETVSE